MAESKYDSARTALLFVDPYNDFMSEGGKFWPQVEAVAEEDYELAARLRDQIRARTRR